jgi:tetratricopeptide (TPR) repeat protein
MAIIAVCGILIQSLCTATDGSAYELYSLGLQYEMEGDLITAIQYYQKALIQDPREPDIYVSLANAFYQIGRFDEGIALARAGLNISPRNEHLLEIIAIGYLGKGDLKRAIKAYDELRKVSPDRIEHYESLSILYEGIQDLDAAQRILLSIPDTLKTPDTYIQLGLLAGKDSEHPRAVDYYRIAYAQDSLNTTALVGLGTGFDILNVKDSAIYYYELSLFEDTLLMTVGRRLVDLYTDVDQYDKVIPIARRILTNDPGDGYTRRSLGYAYYKRGSFDPALQEFMLASRMDPEDVYSRFYMGRIYLENRQYKMALHEITDALRVNPDFIELWIYLGFIAIDTQEFELAKKAFQEAAYRGGDILQIFYLLGVTHEMAGDEKGAYRYYQKAYGVEPTDVPTLDALANLAARIGKEEDAFRFFECIVAIDTMNATAMNYVGYTLADRNEQLDYALELIERALSIDTHNAYFIDSRAWVFYRMGRYEDARHDLERAIDITEDAVILEHLGDVYMALDEPLKAVDAFERASQLDPENKILRKKINQLIND